MVYTFENHPLTIINKASIPKIIMSNKEKISVLENLGVDIVCLYKFDLEMMTMEAEEFIIFLLKRFNTKGFVVGFNYRFGYKNKGDIKLLEKLSEKYNFELIVKKAYKSEGKIVSSSSIRELISKGSIELANDLLTRNFTLDGKIIGGKKLGRTIGFPTANLDIDKKVALPKIGVYYTNTEIEGVLFKSITSVGNNPTVNGNATTVETYILNFSKDIYNKNISVHFIEWIRGEKKFDSLESLKKQLEKDKMYAYQRKIKKNL